MWAQMTPKVIAASMSVPNRRDLLVRIRRFKVTLELKLVQSKQIKLMSKALSRRAANRCVGILLPRNLLTNGHFRCRKGALIWHR